MSEENSHYCAWCKITIYSRSWQHRWDGKHLICNLLHPGDEDYIKDKGFSPMQQSMMRHITP